MSPKLANWLISLITIVWCVNFTVPIFEHDYKPPPEIHLALMAIVGLFISTKTSGNSKKDKEDKG